MAKKMTEEQKLRAILDEDYQKNPNTPYQEDSEVTDAANTVLHSAGNMQRQTYEQDRASDEKIQRAKEDENWKQMKAKALSSKKGK